MTSISLDGFVVAQKPIYGLAASCLLTRVAWNEADGGGPRSCQVVQAEETSFLFVSPPGIYALGLKPGTRWYGISLYPGAGCEPCLCFSISHLLYSLIFLHSSFIHIFMHGDIAISRIVRT